MFTSSSSSSSTLNTSLQSTSNLTITGQLQSPYFNAPITITSSSSDLSSSSSTTLWNWIRNLAQLSWGGEGGDDPW
jgi:hypothetical protein